MNYALTLFFAGEAAALNSETLLFDSLDETTEALRRAVCADGFSDARLVKLIGLPAPVIEDWRQRADYRKVASR